MQYYMKEITHNLFRTKILETNEDAGTDIMKFEDVDTDTMEEIIVDGNSNALS